MATINSNTCIYYNPWLTNLTFALSFRQILLVGLEAAPRPHQIVSADGCCNTSSEKNGAVDVTDRYSGHLSISSGDHCSGFNECHADTTQRVTEADRRFDCLVCGRDCTTDDILDALVDCQGRHGDLRCKDGRSGDASECDPDGVWSGSLCQRHLPQLGASNVQARMQAKDTF
jgi:hypothetical protein